MTDTVTGAGFRVTVPLGGRKYILAAPTFGEAGRITESSATRMRPPPAVIMETIRDALRRLGKEDMVPIVDECEAADIHMSATVLSFLSDSPEVRKEVADARERKFHADLKQRRVEWAVRDDAELLDMRKLASQIDRQEHLALLAVCLKGWEGPEMPPAPEMLTPEFIDSSFPAGDVAALGAKAMGLMAPTKEAAGN